MKRPQKIDPNITEFNGLRIGDMITTYHKGFHKIIGFHELAYKDSMQVNYDRVADNNGNPIKGKNSCHHRYCKKVNAQKLKEDYEFELFSLNMKYNTLNKILNKLEAEQNAATTN